MRFPKHVILDTKKPDHTNMEIYWPYRYGASFSRDAYFNSSLNVKGRFPESLRNRATWKASTTLLIQKNYVDVEDTTAPQSTHSSSLLKKLFDINFLKREKLYTKLKYSRSPAYDIVSGGVAALFSGFIGFLISEKFGIELVDSGDFYTFFMYLVFLGFSLRPLVKILSAKDMMWSFASPKFFVDYFFTLSVLALNFIKSSVDFGVLITLVRKAVKACRRVIELLKNK